MAFAALNERPVFEGCISIPRVGAWRADLAVDNQAAPTGRCTLVIDGGLTLVGTARRTGVWQDTARVRVVGGNGGLSKTAQPKHYTRPTLRLVLADLLRTAGESLASTADATTLALTFGAWVTIGQPIGRMIAALLADSRLPAATAWRMLANGTLWVGKETWPDSGLVNITDYQAIEEWPADGRVELGIEAPRLLPGTTLGGRRVSYVEHRISGQAARTVAWLEG